jgi:CheY-like chemotaxis protein
MSATRTVLLVEDEPALRRFAARALRGAGWRVMEADSAEAALALLAADGGTVPDLLVADVALPGMDGLALLASCAANRRGCRRSWSPVIRRRHWAPGQGRCSSPSPTQRPSCWALPPRP